MKNIRIIDEIESTKQSFDIQERHSDKVAFSNKSYDEIEIISNENSLRKLSDVDEIYENERIFVTSRAASEHRVNWLLIFTASFLSLILLGRTFTMGKNLKDLLKEPIVLEPDINEVNTGKVLL